MTAKEYELIAQAKKQPLSEDKCPFHHYIGTFLHLVSKKFHDHPVTIENQSIRKVKIILQLSPHKSSDPHEITIL